MKQGDWISIVSPLGSTDPFEFARPHQLERDRDNDRHFGFGFGPHVCAGAHLARLELQIALREWLARLPNWRIQPGAEVSGYAGTSFGLHALHLEWNV